MKVVVVGLGVQGKKRAKVAGTDCVAIVDPVNPDASHKRLEEVAPDSYQAALVCTPDQEKLSVLRYLISQKKHILVEKPLFSPHPGDLVELKQMVEKTGLAFYTAYNHRFEPAIARLKEVLDSGRLGQVYLAKLFYGNGTARDVRTSVWRDQGSGVLKDLGSHLLDLSAFLFDHHFKGFEKLRFECFENKAYDYVLFGNRGGDRPRILLEASLLAWKNDFTIEVVAEKGTALVNGLCKWGPSTMTLRTRILPSGRPLEEVTGLQNPDPTWELEYRHFLRLCEKPANSLDNDLWILEQLSSVG